MWEKEWKGADVAAGVCKTAEYGGNGAVTGLSCRGSRKGCEGVKWRIEKSLLWFVRITAAIFLVIRVSVFSQYFFVFSVFEWILQFQWLAESKEE